MGGLDSCLNTFQSEAFFSPENSNLTDDWELGHCQKCTLVSSRHIHPWLFCASCRKVPAFPVDESRKDLPRNAGSTMEITLSLHRNYNRRGRELRYFADCSAVVTSTLSSLL